MWDRPRPTPPQPNKFKHKNGTLRGYENNCSMPSGDSAQGAVFATSFYFLLSEINALSEFSEYFEILYVLIIFSALVCLARVYFMCHYVGDTIIGASMSFFSTYLIYQYVFPVVYKQLQNLV
ncbi:Phosphatidic acid phosphatase type 2/haloperoxidase [Pseudocohnilembus persalinus]|uniref:Phosphatidic acid phosphatase type 2/haloperoxidase n=1 Tax=Pseudocohnilembus persalinus TaxID=266149 RepID=A0A0V0QIX9_PSEPJ|nr:Phosphatidic acid phosphatase type 2/haloperoxidase [Pseudocohnilembus persalinus]|eukprot:KRX02185.1 Phosphatidic acid phosphatase type 2/haloperoxidase [Pseudocohnilembus persalinus]